MSGSRCRGFSAGTAPFGKDPRRIEDQQNGGDQNGNAGQVGAEERFKRLQWVARPGFAQEHEVGAANLIDDDGGHGAEGQKPEQPGNMARLGMNLAACCQQQGIEGQKNVDGEAVDMHAAGGRQRAPGGKKKRRHRAGQADGVEEFRRVGTGPQGVPQNDENIDAAQVQGR